ncbi:hypothetical protein GCM10010172_69790 [Paractinoplanes ferrugineus]|uniref:Uncharacterized protein n=1 Tax=Paractinoplanes ferrugineus TaxID=113564 RepID=A0A919J1M4_9ACTN|nr:hypothetical protein Afe05nite_41900 [Actinoplanes ferrugineus]
MRATRDRATDRAVTAGSFRTAGRRCTGGTAPACSGGTPGAAGIVHAIGAERPPAGCRAGGTHWSAAGCRAGGAYRSAAGCGAGGVGYSAAAGTVPRAAGDWEVLLFIAATRAGAAAATRKIWLSMPSGALVVVRGAVPAGAFARVARAFARVTGALTRVARALSRVAGTFRRVAVAPGWIARAAGRIVGAAGWIVGAAGWIVGAAGWIGVAAESAAGRWSRR